MPSALINKVTIAEGLDVIQKHGISTTKASQITSMAESPSANKQRQMPPADWHHFSGHLVQVNCIGPFSSWRGMFIVFTELVNHHNIMVYQIALFLDQGTHFYGE